MGRAVQWKLFPVSDEHGGELGQGKRKTARPIATKRAMHVIFRARESCLLKHERKITELRQKLAKRNHLTVYEASNNSNHLHLVIRGKTRAGLRNFFRVFAGQVAQLVGDGKLWLVPVYTRVVAWGKAFRAVCAYVYQNHLEATGQVPYKPRKSRQSARHLQIVRRREQR